MKDPKQFRERFKKWKEGSPIEEIYDHGRPSLVEHMKRLAQPMAKNWETLLGASVHLLNDGNKVYLDHRSGYSGGKDDRTYIGGSDQELVVTPGKSWTNPYTGEYIQATESYAQPIASKDPYVDYQFYSPTGNSIVQTINSTPRWQQYWADREGSRVSNAMHQASPKVFDLLTAVDAVATGPEAIEGIYNLSKNLFTKTIPSYQLYRAINKATPRTTAPYKIFNATDLINSGFVETASTGSPLFEFARAQQTVPANSYFMRAPKGIDILKLRNGRYRYEVVGNDILPSGEVNGKFVSYGEPWQEFGFGSNSALYEFPIGPRRGPSLRATDWKGRPQKYSVDEIYDYMLKDRAGLHEKFTKDKELLGLDDLGYSERIQAIQKLKEDKYPELLENFDTSIYGANQTVIPNEKWNFDRFLKTPFWKYSENPISGQVQKELFMRYPEEVLPNVPTVEFKAIPKKHARGKDDNELPEVVVTPTKLDDIRVAQMRNIVPNNRLRKELYDYMNRTGGTMDILPLNDKVDRFIELWNYSNRPKIKDMYKDRYGDWVSMNDDGTSRAYYAPYYNTMYLGDDDKGYTILNELAHAYQRNSKNSVLLKTAVPFEKLIHQVNNDKKDKYGRNGYNRIGNLEYNAHKLIQPSIDEYIFGYNDVSGVDDYLNIYNTPTKLFYEILRDNVLNVLNATPKSKYPELYDPYSSYARGKDSGIYIKPSKRGTFTAAAKKRGLSVLSFASKVLNNPSNYSKAMRKKALFAKNASKFKH